MDKIVKDPSPNWGGKRPGSGRAKTGRVRKFIYVTEEEFQHIKKLVEEMREVEK